jgi:hypothetical protein
MPEVSSQANTPVPAQDRDETCNGCLQVLRQSSAACKALQILKSGVLKRLASEGCGLPLFVLLQLPPALGDG